MISVASKSISGICRAELDLQDKFKYHDDYFTKCKELENENETESDDLLVYN